MKNSLTLFAACTFLLTTAVSTVYGQSAPGGVGDLSGTSVLRFWASSESTNVTTNNTPVDSLFDLSGAGNHVYAPTAAARPVLLTDQINGYPVINFDGIQQYLFDPVSDTTFRNSEATLIAVASQNIHSSVISISAPNSTDEFLILNRRAYHHSSPSNWKYLDHQCAPTDTMLDYVTITGVFGTAVDDLQNYSFRIPSTLDLVSDNTPLPYNMVDKKVHIGQRDLFQNNTFLNGNLVEVMAYNRKLTLVEIDSVITYLENKYQIVEQCASVGISENTLPVEISIFPNPAKGNFIVSSADIIKNGTIEIFTVMGTLIYQKHILNLSREEISLTNISQGVYYVKIFDGKSTYCKKLFVEVD